MKLDRLESFLFIGLIFVLSVQPSFAEVDEKTKNIDKENNQMEHIIVTASGFEQSNLEAPASITIVSQDDLESGNYRNIADAIRGVTGLSILDNGDTKNISIRGLEMDYTLILVDGKRVSTKETRTGFGGGIEHNWLPPIRAIERIEIVRGSMSTRYGSDAMGGVINVITKKDLVDWTGEITISQLLQEEPKSGNETNTDFYLSGPVRSDLSLQVYGQSFSRDEDHIYGGYGDNKQKSITSRLIYINNYDHEFTTEVGISKQLRASTTGYSKRPRNNKMNTRYESDYQRTHASITHNGYWSSSTSDETFFLFEEGKNINKNITERNMTLKSNIILELEKHTISTGVEYNNARLKDLRRNILNEDKSKINFSNLHREQWSIYIEDEWSLNDSLKLTFGMRENYNEKYGFNFSPRVYSVWKVSDKLIIKGGVSTGYRVPRIRSSVSDWVSTSFGINTIGNPDLQPEKSISKEIGIIYKDNSSFVATATIFDTNIDGKFNFQCIDGSYDTDCLKQTRVNLDSAESKGIELSLDKGLSESLDLRATYTFTDSEFKNGDESGKQLSDHPRNQAFAKLTWFATDDIDSWVEWSYQGKTGYYNNPKNSYVNLGSNYSINDNVIIRMSLQNIMNNDTYYYNEDGNRKFVEDGRRLYLSLSSSF